MTAGHDDELDFHFASDEEYPLTSKKREDVKVDEKKSVTSEDVNEDDNNELGGQVVDKSSGLSSVFKNKKILMVGVPLLIGVVYFHFFSSSDSSTPPSTLPVNVVKTQSVKAAPKVTKIVPATTQASAIVSEQMQQANSMMASRVDMMVNTLENNKKTTNQLSKQVASISGVIMVMDQSQKKMLSALEILTNEITSLKSKVKVKKKVIKPKKIIKPVDYTVHAVVPGRAWLENSEHAFSTVAVGDTLQGYGKIVKIDVDNAKVITSSGKVIHYGYNK